jgi:DnaK suppressor protein
MQLTNTKPESKTSYSASELAEFKELIINKLTSAREELNQILSSLSTDNGRSNVGDGSITLQKEEASQLAGRQRKFIIELEAALVRIENKTYGVCKDKGTLIPKGRLLAVPHTTKCIQAKLEAA